MKHDDLDRILSSEPEIVPSVGFVDSVMDTVRHEAAVPPPIPFPWKRALPGLCAAGLALASVLASTAMLFVRSAAAQPGPAPAFDLILQSWKAVGANWMVLALALSLASLKFFTKARTRSS